MTMERKDNTGALFRIPEEKVKSDKHPVYSGICLVNGKEMNISAWINVAKSSGNQYMSLKFEEPMKKESANVDAHTYESTSTDEVPF